MKPAPVPADEALRLAALHRYDLLDTLSESQFDDLTKLAAHICGTPIALISLLDQDRQWFKSMVGIDVCETPRDISFCGHAIAGDDLFEVANALDDARFCDNPLVTGAPDIRFYAGAPLVTEDGFRLGTLCVIDRTPRQLSEDQRDALRALGRQVSRQFESRAMARELESKTQFYQTLVDTLPVGVYSKSFRKDSYGQMMLWNKAAEKITGYAKADVLGKSNAEAFPAEAARAYDAHDAFILAHRQPLEVPLQKLVRADGVRRVRTVSMPMLDAAGHVEYIIGISEDITDVVAQSRDLKRKQAELVAVNDASPLGMFRTDAQGLCTYINKKYEVITGVPPREAYGLGWVAHLHPDDRDRVIASRQAAGQNNTGYVHTQRFIRPDGTQVLCRAMGEPVMIDGVFAGFVGTIDDITERRRTSDALKESETRLRLVADNLPALVGYIDASRRYRFSNRAYRDLMGIDYTTMLGRTVEEIYGAAAYVHMKPEIDAALSGYRVSFERAATSPTQSARLFFQCEYLPDHDADNNVIGFYAMAVDVTARRLAEKKLIDSERRLAAITDNLPVLITYVDHERRLRFANATLKSWVGVAPADVRDRRFEEIYGEAIYQDRKVYIERALAGERVEFEASTRTFGVERHMQVVYVPDRGNDGTIRGFYTLTTDVTTLKESETKLSRLARLDALTGLPNRYQFNEKLDEAIGRSQRLKVRIAVMYLDIDHFKQINDTYGHATGDGVLVEFARRLGTCVRSTDTVARLAGDEFVIILEGLHSAAEPQLVAKKITDAMQLPCIVDGREIAATSSIGVAYGHTFNLTAADLLGLADKSLYAAKRAGRNTFRVSTRGL